MHMLSWIQPLGILWPSKLCKQAIQALQRKEDGHAGVKIRKNTCLETLHKAYKGQISRTERKCFRNPRNSSNDRATNPWISGERINSASGAPGHEYPPQPALLCSLQSHQHVFVDSMKEHQWLSHFYNVNVSVYFLFIPCKEMVLWRSKSPCLPPICLRGEMAAELNG